MINYLRRATSADAGSGLGMYLRRTTSAAAGK